MRCAEYQFNKNDKKKKRRQEKAAELNKNKKNSVHKQTHASSFWITVIQEVFLGLRDQRQTIEKNRKQPSSDWLDFLGTELIYSGSKTKSANSDRTHM